MRKPNRLNKKAASWILMLLGLALLVAWLVIRFAFKSEIAVTLDAAALCLVGLSMSLDYEGRKFRIPLRILQGLALALIAANAVSWLVAFPHPAILAIRLAAIAVNVPLAALGLKKAEKPKEEAEEAIEEETAEEASEEM